ncbi:MAG: RagB/SusD family nutrient uptake outer membrane protein, partial [Pedobacter sp.]
TKGAVKGILARVALYGAGYSLRWDLQTGSLSSLKMGVRADANRIRELYTIARDECNEIMLSNVHRLNPSFENVWKNIAAYRLDNVYRENIMEIAFYSRLSVRGEAGYYGNYNGPESRILSAPAHGTSAGAMWVMPSFYLSYDPEDSRRDITAASHVFTAQPKGTPTALYNLTVGKWRNGWAASAPSSLTNFNFPLLRYADVLLMFAEADSWLNDGRTSAAADALKLVRKRAFPTKVAAIEAEVYPTGLVEFMKLIVDERAFELAFEGFRKTDLIRFNKLAEKINWAKAENEAINNSYSSTGNRPYAGSIVRLQGKVIPASRVYKDTGNSYGVEIRETSTRPDNTWGSGQWLGAAFKANMAIFASGFKENYSEVYPVPLSIRDVTTAIGQVPGY